MGIKSIISLTWDVQQQTKGTFQQQTEGINDMTNFELFPIG
jgi:hypothetical protein